MWCKTGAVVCVAVLALLADVARVTGQVTAYRLPGATWTLGVPVDWTVQDDDVVAARVKEALEHIENAPTAKYALVLNQNEHEERIVSVERTPVLHRKMSFDAAAKGFFEAWRKRSDEAAKTSIGLVVESMTANAAARQLVIIGETRLPHTEAFGTVVVMHFGARETVIVSAGAPLPAFKADHADLVQIASSVTFDAGEAFAFSEGRREGDFSEAMGKVVAACLFLALILYAIKKSQAKKGEAA